MAASGFGARPAELLGRDDSGALRVPSESEKGDADLGAILLPKELAPGLEEKREQLAAEEHARRAAIKAGCAKRCAAIMKREQ